jgi:hypothetical protein
VTAIDFGNQDAIVAVVEGDTRFLDKSDAEPVVDINAKALLELGDNPVAPVAGVPAPAVGEATGRYVGPRRLASSCECCFIAFHY